LTEWHTREVARDNAILLAVLAVLAVLVVLVVDC
jgi:hypothetical protein